MGLQVVKNIDTREGYLYIGAVWGPTGSRTPCNKTMARYTEGKSEDVWVNVSVWFGGH